MLALFVNFKDNSAAVKIKTKTKMENSDNLLSNENKGRCIKELSDLKPLRKPKDPKSYAAVLVPLIQLDDGQSGLLFTKRSSTLRRNPREVCYPGGKVDDQESFIEAAKRETFEEIGISKDSIDIWGAMPALSDHTGTLIQKMFKIIYVCTPHIVLIGTRAVIPIVGYLQEFHPSKLKPNKAEVQDVFVKPVLDLHRPHVAGYTQFRVPNSPGYSLPIYNCQPYPIWGMTAIITFQFLSVFLRGRKGFRHKLNYQSPILTKN